MVPELDPDKPDRDPVWPDLDLAISGSRSGLPGSRSGNIFHFHFCLFFCTQYSKYLYLRQLRYGAGGFSYKSRWTLRELFPLFNFGCKCFQIAKEKIYKNDTVTSSKKGSQRGIPSTIQTSKPPRRKDKKMKR